MLPFVGGFAPRPPAVFDVEVIGTGVGSGTIYTLPDIDVAIHANTLIGDLLIMVGTMRGSNGSGWGVATPSGWSTLYNTSFTQFYRRCFAFYRTADADGAGTVSVTYSGNPGSNGASASASIITIRNNVSNPEVETGVAATSTTPNPPSITPTGGNKTYLVIPTVHIDWITSTTAGITEPSGYDPLSESSLKVSTNYFAGAATAIKQETGTSFDPGTWTLDASKANYANTITVR